MALAPVLPAAAALCATCCSAHSVRLCCRIQGAKVLLAARRRERHPNEVPDDSPDLAYVMSFVTSVGGAAGERPACLGLQTVPTATEFATHTQHIDVNRMQRCSKRRQGSHNLDVWGPSCSLRNFRPPPASPWPLQPAAYWTRRSSLGLLSGLGVGSAFALGGYWIQAGAKRTGSSMRFALLPLAACDRV